MVELKFNQFDLEGSREKAADCPYDYVQINGKKYITVFIVHLILNTLIK